MGWGRFEEYVERVREELHSAFAENHTPRELAGSFALGTFVTILPTFGTGLLLFVVLVYLFDRVSKLALFASVVVFNPGVKWGVYAASFALGVFLLGPIEGSSMTDVSLGAGPAIAVRLLIGNLLVAATATVVAYVVVHRLAVRYTSTLTTTTIDETFEDVAKGSIEP